MSKCHIVGNLMSRFIYIYKCTEGLEDTFRYKQDVLLSCLTFHNKKLTPGYSFPILVSYPTNDMFEYLGHVMKHSYDTFLD